MIKIIDFAKKAKTTLLIAFMVIIAGSYARQEILAVHQMYNSFYHRISFPPTVHLKTIFKLIEIRKQIKSN